MGRRSKTKTKKTTKKKTKMMTKTKKMRNQVLDQSPGKIVESWNQKQTARAQGNLRRRRMWRVRGRYSRWKRGRDGNERDVCSGVKSNQTRDQRHWSCRDENEEERALACTICTCSWVSCSGMLGDMWPPLGRIGCKRRSHRTNSSFSCAADRTCNRGTS